MFRYTFCTILILPLSACALPCGTTIDKCKYFFICPNNLNGSISTSHNQLIITYSFTFMNKTLFCSSFFPLMMILLVNCLFKVGKKLNRATGEGRMFGMCWMIFWSTLQGSYCYLSVITDLQIQWSSWQLTSWRIRTSSTSDEVHKTARSQTHSKCSLNTACRSLSPRLSCCHGNINTELHSDDLSVWLHTVLITKHFGKGRKYVLTCLQCM